MKTHVEELDGNNVRLTVTVPAEEVDAAIDEAYKRIAKKIKIPGFRAGKAPKPVIDTHVGRDAVVNDAQDEVLNESYGKALDAEKLRPIAQPEIGEFDEMEPGKDFEFVAEVQVRPELTLSSTEDLKITVPSKTATDREVEAQVDLLRQRSASLEPVEGRGVQADDFVLLSFVGKIDGEDYEGNTVDKYLYEMNRGLMPDEFDQALMGTEIGGETQAAFEVPDTSSNEEFVGKTATFDITVHEIKAKVLPEVDDDFAVNVAGFESVGEMRNSIKQQLDRSKDVGHRRALEDESRKALAERLEGDVPEPMVENTRQQMLRDLMNSFESQGMTIDDYLAGTGMTLEQLADDMKARAEGAVREELALEALFRAKDMEVTDADIDAEIAMFADNSDQSPEELRARWEETGVIAVLFEQVMHRKAIEWLLANVAVSEESEPAAEKAEPGKKPSKKKSKKEEAAPEASDEAAANDSKE